MVHEPEAKELTPDLVLQDRFDQGQQVTQIARTRFPDGVMIAPGDQHSRLDDTRQALKSGAPDIFEAAFLADGVFVSVDVLRDVGDGYRIVEVKSSSSVKDEHIPDVAIQTHVLRRTGLKVVGADIMHLNTDFRFPDTGDLFRTSDVTERVEELLPQVPAMIAAQVAALEGSLPEVKIGLQCFEPRECAFHDRCWPQDPDHISTLYNNGPKRTVQYMAQGIHSLKDIPATQKLPDAARRQLEALKKHQIVVEPSLKQTLDETLGDARLGYLDFETVGRAVPVWNGLGPWRQAAAQFSYHEEAGGGQHTHDAFLAEGDKDPRPELVDRMLEATFKAERVVMYSSFEKTQINALAEQLPAVAGDLHALAAKLVDLLPVVRNNVYHPGFKGSFSLKYILSPLIPDLSYSDLAIVDGQVASVTIARLLFVAHKIKDRDRTRRDLLDYCERDTFATVRLVARLRELAR
ncbi:MAG TPA: DUF2779 domain-containing protein [Gemmatimonadales bacterium]